MSSRSLRKLHGENNLACSNDVEKITETDDSTPEEDSPDGKTANNASVNKKSKNKSRVLNQFELLADAESDDKESQNTHIANSEEHGHQTQALAEHPADILPSNKKKKKKRKKKKAPREEIEQSNKTTDAADEIEASLREVNQLLGENALVTMTTDRNYANEDSRGILSVEHKHLNPDSEMRRIFGSRVVQTEQSRRRNRNRPVQRSTWLVQAKENWPSLGRTGISMTLDDDVPAGSGQYFRFEHSSQYQQVQFEFLDAVESFHPDNIMAILRLQPYHIAACLQLSEICRMGEDMQMATSLVERALYGCETAFHPLFNITQGNCHLDYRRPENRSFYVGLFRHLTFVGQRGCNRTALEFCKLLLSLDSDADPLCVLLMIDFYALRSEQYSYLIRMFDEWEPHRNLSQLPNFAYSVSLALYKHALETDSSTQRADDMLADTLLMYPGVLLPLLEKCSVVPDTTVAKHPFFTDNSTSAQPASLKQLQDLYIGRCHACWKEPEIVSWLEETVSVVMALVNSDDQRVELYRQKRLTRYRGTPRNIYRHIIMSEIKDASANLPPDMSQGAMMSYDPLPPIDSIDSYTRPVRPTRLQQDGNVLSSFLRSLLPNFNVNDSAEQVQAGHAGGEAGGAAGGEENQAQSLRQGINTLMTAMGDLLQNIRMIDAPREDQEGGEEGEGGEEDANNEWD